MIHQLCVHSFLCDVKIEKVVGGEKLLIKVDDDKNSKGIIILQEDLKRMLSQMDNLEKEVYESNICSSS